MSAIGAISRPPPPTHTLIPAISYFFVLDYQLTLTEGILLVDLAELELNRNEMNSPEPNWHFFLFDTLIIFQSKFTPEALRSLNRRVLISFG